MVCIILSALNTTDGFYLYQMIDRELQEWKIPPSISDWKNTSGYTIPLEKRQDTAGHSLQDEQSKFARFEALNATERKVHVSCLVGGIANGGGSRVWVLGSGQSNPL